MPAWLAEKQPAKRQKFCILCLEKIFTENNGVEKNRAVQNSVLKQWKLRMKNKVRRVPEDLCLAQVHKMEEMVLAITFEAPC